MLIPASDVDTAVGGYDRLTCKYKERTAGFLSGPPPTPKLDEEFLERERIQNLYPKKT
jgi:hypothetical protein